MQVVARKVARIAPLAGTQQRMHAGAIAACGCAKHAPQCLLVGMTRIYTLRHPCGCIAQNACPDRVVLRIFVLRRHGAHGGIKHLHHTGEGIAKKATDPQGHIYARAAQAHYRNNFKIHHPLAAGSPFGAHADQRKRLGDIVAAGAHGGRAPD